jgi:hypothetical protein
MLLTLVMSALLFRPAVLAAPDLNKPQPIQTRLHSQVAAYTLSANDFAHALIRLACKFNLPMGIEWVRSPGTLKKVSLSWKNATIQQMLDTLVKSQPGYQLEISNGVAHVFPGSINSSQQDFLTLKIEKFEVHNQVVEIASHDLRDLVRRRISPPPPSSQRPAGVGYSQGANIGDPEFSLALQDVSVRQILDNMTLASDRKIWVVTFIDAPPSATGFLRTATLWQASDVPDADQPVWDMFRWNDTIP